MLKIKNNIDLEELKKFGFYQSNKRLNSWDYELKIKEPTEDNCFADDGFAILTVKEYEPDGTRTNKELLLMTNTNDEVWYELDGVIYDLIKADMVEVCDD